jgi:hypothetical protein
MNFGDISKLSLSQSSGSDVMRDKTVSFRPMSAPVSGNTESLRNIGKLFHVGTPHQPTTICILYYNRTAEHALKSTSVSGLWF